MRLFNDTVDELIKNKCEPDSDGDYPIDFYAINCRIERFACSPLLLRVSKIGAETINDTRSIALAIESLSKELRILLSWLEQKQKEKNDLSSSSAFKKQTVQG